MSGAVERIGTDELHAYVDGRLDPERRAAVERFLADCPDSAAQVAAWGRFNEEIRALFVPVLAEPVPARLLRRPAPLPRPALRRIAAAALWLMLGLGGGWMLRGAAPPVGTPTAVPLPRQALSAHLVFAAEVRHPVEVGADQRDHLAGWLSNRLGGRVHVPDLGDAGFTLVGGRLLAADGLPAALFMYETVQGERLTLYVRTDRGGRDTAFRYASEAGLAAAYWVENAFGYALVGPLDRDRLQRVAHLAYQQLAP